MRCRLKSPCLGLSENTLKTNNDARPEDYELPPRSADAAYQSNHISDDLPGSNRVALRYGVRKLPRQSHAQLLSYLSEESGKCSWIAPFKDSILPNLDSWLEFHDPRNFFCKTFHRLTEQGERHRPVTDRLTNPEIADEPPRSTSCWQ